METLSTLPQLEMTMRISRRELAALTGAALVFRARHAKAADADIFVPGQNLPANLDPHQILDIGGDQLRAQCL